MTKYTKVASAVSALALAMSMGFNASAQSTGGDSGAGGQGGGQTASNMTFQSWLNAQNGKGRITRQMYMDESQRRWDMMDKEKKGLTMQEINGMYYSSTGMGGPTTTSPQDKKGIKQ